MRTVGREGQTEERRSQEVEKVSKGEEVTGGRGGHMRKVIHMRERR